MTILQVEEENFEKEFDKIFHGDKEQLPKNSSAEGEIDEERKKYYRSSSVDETAAGLAARNLSSGDNEPLQGKILVTNLLCFISPFIDLIDN